MGGGSWTTSNYASYTCSVGRSYDSSSGTFSDTYTNAGQAFVSRDVDEKMKPWKILRECCDSEEHPQTFPIILALDVTGSMGQTAIEVQKKLNPIMTEILEDKSIKDPELMIMALGDLDYDSSPIQISQFESDTRIAVNLDKVYFENGGGGNDWESYTAAWYMALKHCRLDCWKRGKKGLIITMGDEPLNPYLPAKELSRVTGDEVAQDVSTKDLYEQVKDKYDVVHICIESGSYPDQTSRKRSFDQVLGGENVVISSVDDLHKKIVDIVRKHAGGTGGMQNLQVIGW